MTLFQPRYGSDNPAWKGGKATYTCGHCGQTFEDYPSNRTGHSIYFCNRACQSTWQSEHRRRENSPSWKGARVTLTCVICKQPYETSTHQAKHYNSRFCSRACVKKWLSENHSGENSPSWKGVSAERPCDECGKMYRPHSTSKKRQQEQRNGFCSRTCSGIWKSKNLVGERAARWTGGKTEYYGPNWMRQARAARKRDGHKCRHCGTKKGQKKKALDVHHIKPFKSFGYIPGENDYYLAANDLTNLITLCPACHKDAETGEIPIQPYLL